MAADTDQKVFVKRLCFLGTESEYQKISQTSTSDINGSIDAAVKECFFGAQPGFCVTFHILDDLPDCGSKPGEKPLFMLVFSNLTEDYADEAKQLQNLILEKFSKLFEIPDLGKRQEKYEKIRDRRVDWILDKTERPTRVIAVTNILLKKDVDPKKHFRKIISDDGDHRTFDVLPVPDKFLAKKHSAQLNGYVLLFEFFDPEEARESLNRWRTRKNNLGQPVHAHFLPEGQKLDLISRLPSPSSKGLGPEQLSDALRNCIREEWINKMDKLHENVVVVVNQNSHDVVSRSLKPKSYMDVLKLAQVALGASSRFVILIFFRLFSL